jgi:lambda repressor-like predicted transcriptional regulator
MEDLALLFSNTPDKYTLIADLHGKGYSIEDLSRYSGLPSGEVRLVISLNR